MNAPTREEIEGVFGPQALAWGLFYQNAPALRFELSDGGGYVEMFTRAYDRAREILSVVFAGTSELVVVLSEAGGGGMLAHLSGFRALRGCGVPLPSPYAAWTETTGAEWDHEERVFLSFRCGREMLNRLLWGALATDIGIRPRLISQLYLADLGRGILAHPYDDRGMDLIGPNHALLAELHARFNPWLLDFDRERMAGFFAG
ncbi:MAG TPA: DUF3885 domain-containing protein [Longimicrobium sp.]|nr:DUF3885 domain-containing protein [Longimicrobium sp.]